MIEVLSDKRPFYNKEEAMMYEFMNKGWRIPNSKDLMIMHYQLNIALGVWTQDLLNAKEYDETSYATVLVRDVLDD